MGIALRIIPVMAVGSRNLVLSICTPPHGGSVQDAGKLTNSMGNTGVMSDFGRHQRGVAMCFEANGGGNRLDHHLCHGRRRWESNQKYTYTATGWVCPRC